MTKVTPERDISPATVNPLRRGLILGLPAAAAIGALPAPALALEPPPAQRPDVLDTEHVRRFYELARF